MRILVIGGTLFIGRVLVRKLRSAGHRVAILHRKSTHDLGGDIESLTADRNDPDAVEQALAGARFDAVFDNVFDWTHGTTAQQVLASAQIANAGQYIFMSSVAAYGRDGSGEEEIDLAPDDHPDLYARHKAQSERALFASGLPVTTLRPPFIYGPRNPYDREAWFWRRFEAGRPALVPGLGERQMQFIHVEDLAEAAVRCLGNRQALGQAFNVAGPPVTQLEFVKTLASAGEYQPEIYGVPRGEIERAGGNAMGPASKLYFGEYLDLPPILQKTDKAERLLGGFTARPLNAGLSDTHRVWRSQVQPQPAAPTAATSESEESAVTPYAWEDGLLSCDSRVRLAGGSQ
jgi:2'-hydroxyisoflavone reductase